MVHVIGKRYCRGTAAGCGYLTPDLPNRKFPQADVRQHRVSISTNCVDLPACHSNWFDMLGCGKNGPE